MFGGPHVPPAKTNTSNISAFVIHDSSELRKSQHNQQKKKRGYDKEGDNVWGDENGRGGGRGRDGFDPSNSGPTQSAEARRALNHAS